MSSGEGGVWNMVWVGSPGAPTSHCSNSGGSPYTTIAATPVIAEKPYLVKENGFYKLMRPKVEFNKVGHTVGWSNADEIDFTQVYVASDKDTAATINGKLFFGYHIVL